MTAMLASGTWVLICFLVLAIGGVLGWFSLRGHLRKIDIPDDQR